MTRCLPVLLSVVSLAFVSGCHVVGGPSEPATPEEAAAIERAASESFMTAQATKPGARRMASGLVIRETRAGTGRNPSAGDTVTFRYETRLRDGRLIDASSRHGGSLTLPLSGLLPCWTEALPQLRAGAAAELYCPAPLAYGDAGIPPLVPPNAALAYEIELVDVGRTARPIGH